MMQSSSSRGNSNIIQEKAKKEQKNKSLKKPSDLLSPALQTKKVSIH